MRDVYDGSLVKPDCEAFANGGEQGDDPLEVEDVVAGGLDINCLGDVLEQTLRVEIHSLKVGDVAG